SEEENRDWIWTQVDNSSYPEPSSNSGKFLLFINPDAIDYVWTQIKKFMLKGLLTKYAKVSTAFRANILNKKNYVICIYTYDYTDSKDLIDIKKKLIALEFNKNRIKYKTDRDTRMGIYYSNQKT
ncbi:MAG: DUF1917 domain-containing protein, partial [Campylobacterales bacterium]|nr:DUF1917 domain-containing protein [Campylobacterales bacterium]